MPVEFKPKAGKPHIKIYIDKCVCYLWPFNLTNPIFSNVADHQERLAMGYCSMVNFGHYKTPGEAARALHGIK